MPKRLMRLCYKTKSQYSKWEKDNEILELKDSKTKVKNSMDELNHKLDISEELYNLKICQNKPSRI